MKEANNPKINSVILPLNAIEEKYSSIEFENLENYNNNKLLLDSLENIEILNNILAAGKPRSFEEKIYITLLYQIISTSQEQLSKDFTGKYPALGAISFAETTNGKKTCWFDRLSIAHILDFNEIIDNWQPKEEDIKRSCKELHSVILNIFKKSNCLTNESIKLIFLSKPLEIDHLASTSKIELSPNIILNKEHHYLFNILKAIKDTKEILTDTGKGKFKNSLAKQCFILMLEEIVGNNVKKYLENYQLPNELKSLEDFIPKRNNIAHSKLLRNLVSNPDLLYRNIKSITEISRKVEQYLVDKKILTNEKSIEDITAESIVEIKDSSKFIQPKKKLQRKTIQKEPEYVNKDLSLKELWNSLSEKKCLRIIANIISCKNAQALEEFLDLGVKNIDELIRFTLLKVESDSTSRTLALYSLSFDYIDKKENAQLVKSKVVKEQIAAQLKASKNTIIEDRFLSKLTVMGTYLASGIKPKKYFNSTLFGYACRTSDMNLIETFLPYKPDLNSTSLSMGAVIEPILHTLVTWKKYEIVKLLLEAGANPNSVDELGRTALSKSIIFGQDIMTDLLIEYGAEFDNKIPHSSSNNMQFIIHDCIEHNPKYLVSLCRHILNQGSYSKLRNVISARMIQVANKHGKIIHNDITDKINNAQAKLIANLLEICSVESFQHKEIYQAILMNDKESIEGFLEDKTAKEIAAIFKFKTSPTKFIRSEHLEEGYTPIELAKAFEYPELATYLQNIAKKALMESLNIPSQTIIQR